MLNVHATEFVGSLPLASPWWSVTLTFVDGDRSVMAGDSPFRRCAASTRGRSELPSTLLKGNGNSASSNVRMLPLREDSEAPAPSRLALFSHPAFVSSVASNNAATSTKCTGVALHAPGRGGSDATTYGRFSTSKQSRAPRIALEGDATSTETNSVGAAQLVAQLVAKAPVCLSAVRCGIHRPCAVDADAVASALIGGLK